MNCRVIHGSHDGDDSSFHGLRLDLRGLISREGQRQFGRVVIGAFLEVTLRGRREHLPLFRDHRVAGAWLPKTMYVTRFQESHDRALASYEDDVDVTTASVPGVTLRGDSPPSPPRRRRSAPRASAASVSCSIAPSPGRSSDDIGVSAMDRACLATMDRR